MLISLETTSKIQKIDRGITAADCLSLSLSPNFSENIVSFEFFSKGDSCMIMAVLESPSVWE